MELTSKYFSRMISLASRHSRLALIALTLLTALLPLTTSALPLTTYTTSSRLSTGRWVKVSVAESGVHLLTPSALRQMGFNDPSKVRVFGYGAMRLPERLDASYIDDLPEVQTLRNDAGIMFYAQGPVAWSSNRPVQNPFTTLGYYFLTDSAEGEAPSIGVSGTAGATDPATTFICRLHHELEQVSPGHTGHILVGESFVNTRSRNFNFTLTDLVPGKATLITSFVAKAPVRSSVTYSINGTAFEASSSDNMSALTDQHAHYSEAQLSRTFDADAEKVTVGVTYNSTSDPSLANLNYIVINYPRQLNLRGSSLDFTISSRQGALAGADASTVLWDVTDPSSVSAVNTSLNGTTLSWTASSGGSRSYVAFKPAAGLAAPKYVGTVANQDLHAAEVPDMVIFTPKEFVDQANRLADRRRNGPDSLKVMVVDQSLVFNEFASGAADVQAFRKMLKMFWDRSSGSDTKLRYALFFGRGTYDNRQLTAAIQGTRYPKMPIWQSDRGTSDSDSYTTDDIFAFLEDGAGSSLSSDKYMIGVGRLPVSSVDDARNAIDKIIAYEEDQPRSNWRNHTLLVADDEDSGIHLSQTEEMWRQMLQSNGGNDVVYTKLYTDLYPREGNVAKLAHDNLLKYLEEGMAWLTYIGHANTTSWSHESLLTYSDINNLHLRHYPILYAATCEFLRWDDAEISAAEIMWKLTTGGCIAVISANRPVYISENGPLSAAYGRHMFRRDAYGKRLTIGEINAAAKNDYRNTDRDGNYLPVSANSNKLRYVLLGDPSMRPIVPDNRVVIETINEIVPGSETQAIVMANQDARVTGKIVDHNGNDLSSFNGTLNLTLYDADKSLTTLGTGESGVKAVFDQHGDRLYEGYHPVNDGRFDFTIAMPSEIANNFREATMAMYAYNSDSAVKTDASGVEQGFYVYGRDENAAPDTIPPVIKTFYLNHSTFTDGSIVNSSPVAIAEISDNRGLNMSSAGIGHQMLLKLDGQKSYTDVSQYFTSSTDGSPSGTIAYPLEDLAEGEHSLMLRIWDASGNSATSTLTFYVSADAPPTLYDVYTDANPASVEANFYLSHDRPESIIDVTLTIYNLLGKPVWSTTQTGRSDVFLSFPINWNLTDNAGRRVNRGIYLYRASVTSKGATSETVTHKIAVAAQ